MSGAPSWKIYSALAVVLIFSRNQLMTHRSLSDFIPAYTHFCTTEADSTTASPIRLWSKGDFSIVETSSYNHSYPFQANLPPPITVANFPPSTASPCVDLPDLRSSANDHLTVRAVFYVNTKINSNYDTWIRGQFLEFAPVDELYIVADAHSCAEERRLYDAFDWLRSHRNESVIELECHDGPIETFEYRGIHKLWELGQSYPARNDIGIYFHSKGLTHAKNWRRYTRGRPSLTGDVFGKKSMHRIREVFRLFPSVDIAGLECAKLFWVWYNFMYARGSYLNTVEQPIVNKRRHYYEDWLGRSGLEPQENAPNATERPFHLYPPHRAYSCYALSADHATSANLGYYFNETDQIRYLHMGPTL